MMSIHCPSVVRFYEYVNRNENLATEVGSLTFSLVLLKIAGNVLLKRAVTEVLQTVFDAD